MACAHGASAATIDVFEMGMTTEVGVNGMDDYDWVSTPTNPFVATHHAQLGMTQATTNIDVAWGPDGGRFDFLFDQVIEDSTSYVASKTYGGVGIVSDVDLWLDYEYSYSYSNLGGDFAINSSTRVTHITNDGFTHLTYDTQLGGAGWLQPSSGTFTASYELLLEAGQRYGIVYDTQLDSGADFGLVGSGAGSLHFTLTPVPEPTTALLLALSAIALFRRVAHPFRNDDHDDRIARPAGIQFKHQGRLAHRKGESP